MNLKNYTSEVPAHLSMAKIEKNLIEAGATDISKSYDENKICSANVEACYKVLKA